MAATALSPTRDMSAEPVLSRGFSNTLPYPSLIITHKFLEPPAERIAKAEIIRSLFDTTWLVTITRKSVTKASWHELESRWLNQLGNLDGSASQFRRRQLVASL